MDLSNALKRFVVEIVPKITTEEVSKIKDWREPGGRTDAIVIQPKIQLQNLLHPKWYIRADLGYFLVTLSDMAHIYWLIGIYFFRLMTSLSK